MDALQQLAPQPYPHRLAPLLHTVEVRVADQLQSFLDQLVVDLTLTLYLFLRLETCRQSALELSKPHIVQLRRVDVVPGDLATRLERELDRPIDRVVALSRVIARYEDVAIHVPLGAKGYE